MTTIWRCRACETYNDFDGVERVLNEQVKAAGEVVMLSQYVCAGCGFSLEINPMHFVAQRGDKRTFIESGYSPLNL